MQYKNEEHKMEVGDNLIPWDRLKKSLQKMKTN